jgi:uncharacterized protein
MHVTIPASYRAPIAGAAAAILLIGAFLIGTYHAPAANAAARGRSSSAPASTTTSTGRITVTGTGSVTGTPNQLTLSMGVQVNAQSVSTALEEANAAVRRVTGALRAGGVERRDIQTSGLYIQPNYQGSSQAPTSYGVGESLTATLTLLAKAGRQIQAAVHAGGNVVTVDGVSLNLTDTGILLSRARASAVADARTKASQFAHALGRKLGRVISITPNQPAQALYQSGFNAVAAPAAGKHSSVPISPGSQQVSVSITVVYAV